jgi:hypothetical protein
LSLEHFLGPLLVKSLLSFAFEYPVPFLKDGRAAHSGILSRLSPKLDTPYLTNLLFRAKLKHIPTPFFIGKKKTPSR